MGCSFFITNPWFCYQFRHPALDSRRELDMGTAVDARRVITDWITALKSAGANSSNSYGNRELPLIGLIVIIMTTKFQTNSETPFDISWMVAFGECHHAIAMLFLNVLKRLKFPTIVSFVYDSAYKRKFPSWFKSCHLVHVP